MTPTTSMTTNSTTSRSAARLLVALVAGLAVSSAGAQNALGDGRALDNSLNARSRYNTARPSLREQFAFQNSIVTGNAPNGLSFRGDVGYLAPGEFRSDLGSNDLFSFRRDSLQSGIAGMGIRGTEALQYQFSLTTGSRPPSNLVGRYSVSRSGTTPDAGQIGSLNNPDEMGGLQQRPAIDPESDERGTMLWMLRSPSAFMSNSSLQTSALRRVETDSGIYSLTASPLRGVRLSPIPELTEARNAQLEAIARQQEEEANTFGKPSRGEDADENGKQDSRTNTRTNNRDSNQIDPSDPERGPVRTLHTDIIRDVRMRDAKQGEDVFNDRPTLADRIAKLRRQLLGLEEAEGGGDIGNGESSGDASGATPGGSIRFDADTMQLLRGDGTPISQYVDPEAATRNVYAEHLAAGQDLMAKGRYFDAEERFASALGIRRGDVTAQVGRLHAQIGAGLYLSASLNIQALGASHPEIFAARYAPELLPAPDRIEDLVRVLSDLIDDSSVDARRASPQVRQSAGLLLGYLGYQIGRPDLVEAGMTSFLERTTKGLLEGEPRPPEARLGDLYYQMWTSGKNDG